MGRKESNQTNKTTYTCTGFIRVREMSGKFKFFQGQGIVREFYVVSVKNRYLQRCRGNVREFYNFSLYQMMINRKLQGHFKHFGYQA